MYLNTEVGGFDSVGTVVVSEYQGTVVRILSLAKFKK